MWDAAPLARLVAEMNTKTLEYFLKIQELKSFSKAAIVLGTSQPALSRAIRDLEAEWQVRLFYRDGRGVRMTEQGEQFAKHAVVLVEQLDLIRRDFDELGNDRLQGATIGLLPSLARLLAVPLMAALRDSHPGSLLRIVEGSTGHLLEWLGDGRLDVALLYDTIAVRRMNPEPLHSVQLNLVGSTKFDPLAPRTAFADLADRPLVLSSRVHGNRREIEAIARRQGIKLDVRYEIDSLSSLIRLVEEGQAWAILPQSAISHELRAASLQSSLIVDPSIDRIVVLASPLNKPFSTASTLLLRSIRTEVKRLDREFSTASAPVAAATALTPGERST